MTDRKLDIKRLKRAQNAIRHEYQESGLVGISDRYIQISCDHASDIALIDRWKFREMNGKSQAFEIEAHGVRWVTLVDPGEQLS